MLRLPKDCALRFAGKWAPLYAELFVELKQKGGRVQIKDRYSRIRNNVASYVQFYEDERRLGISALLALFGVDGFKQFAEESKTWGEQELAECVNHFTSAEGDNEIDQILANLPETDDEWAEQEALFLSLPEEEKAERTKQAGFLFGSFFAQFFNTLSLMTHGAKLTSLVPQALAGDKEAFLKAVQVDRLLLTHHPYFASRKQKAQDEGEDEFLSALGYREQNPTLQGKIRYPGLYFLFGILDSLNWLDDLAHTEILDLCDEIGLDRYQNRIEDVNYLTKRLGDYRRFQKTGGVSMQ